MRMRRSRIDGMADGVEHVSHLPLPAFVQRDLDRRLRAGAERPIRRAAV